MNWATITISKYPQIKQKSKYKCVTNKEKFVEGIKKSSLDALVLSIGRWMWFAIPCQRGEKNRLCVASKICKIWNREECKKIMWVGGGHISDVHFGTSKYIACRVPGTALWLIVMHGCKFVATKRKSAYICSPVCANADVYSKIYLILKSRKRKVKDQFLLRNSGPFEFEQTKTRAVFVATTELSVARYIKLGTCSGVHNFLKKWIKMQWKYQQNPHYPQCPY